MFIETETTPYPARLKFLPGCSVMEKGTADFTDANDARHSPLATALIGVEGITRVFLVPISSPSPNRTTRTGIS